VALVNSQNCLGRLRVEQKRRTAGVGRRWARPAGPPWTGWRQLGSRGEGLRAGWPPCNQWPATL